MLLSDFYFLHFCFYFANILIVLVPLILENTEYERAKINTSVSVLRCNKAVALHMEVLRALPSVMSGKHRGCLSWEHLQPTLSIVHTSTRTSTPLFDGCKNLRNKAKAPPKLQWYG